MCVFLLLLTLTACKLLHFFPLCYGMKGFSKAANSRSPSSRGSRQRAAEAAPLPAEPLGSALPAGKRLGTGNQNLAAAGSGQACDSRRQHPPAAASPAPSPAG